VPLPPVSFPTLGWQVIEWIEAYLVHGPGDVQGELWTPDTPGCELDDEEALFICWLYRVWPQGHQLAGRRLAHRAVYSRPKGRRKSEIAGALVCAEALGPVRCDGFDADGDPVGVPVTYPFLRCLATEEDQAGNTYDNVVFMLTEGAAADEYSLDVGRSIESSSRVFIKEPGGGEIRPSSSGDASKDGGKESAAVADETHLYTSRQLRTMYRTVARNTGKRKIAEPLMLDTTTAWQPGERSIAEQAADRYQNLDPEACLIKHGVLYDHRQGDEPKRFGDDRSLIKAMRPGYGPAANWMDFGRIVKIVRDAEDPEAEAYRYFLNRPRAASSHWLAPAEIAAVLHDELGVKPGSMVTGGFDGSENNDHTALMGCTERGDLFTVGIWTPEPDDLGWRDDVNAAVDWLFATFKVARFYGDPPWWQEDMGRWAAKHGSPPVIEFWTNIDSKMAVACGALRTEIRRGEIKLDPHPRLTEEQERQGKTLLAWHFENARTRKVKIKLDDKAEEAYVVRKDRPGSQLKIDSVTSSVLARRARDDALKAGEFEQPNYGRWSDSKGTRARKRVDRSEYLPCVGCGKPIHPNLHRPDAPEQGLCVRCRSRRPN
jgi:hypothetical protein